MVSISKEKWNMEEVVLEELQIFKVRQSRAPEAMVKLSSLRYPGQCVSSEQVCASHSLIFLFLSNGKKVLKATGNGTPISL